MDVYAPDGSYVTTVTWVWPGCACGSFADRSDVIVRFPSDANYAQRAALMGGVMLVEYTSMELKRTQEGNSAVARDSSYSGLGAKYATAPSRPASARTAAPTTATMER